MDYRSLKRSQLQALCKKHNIPGNSTNAVMADKLSELLNVKQEKQKPKAGKRPSIKNSVETVDESESAVSRRQSKKVRFSPEVEYERSGKKPKDLEPVVTEMKGRTRRKSVARNVDKPVVDKDGTVTDDVQIPVKVTRSRAHIKDDVIVVPANEKKRGRKAVKDVEKETEEVEEPEVNVGKVTRSKANTVGKSDVQPEKSKQSKRAVKEVEKESEPVKDTVVARGRATRSNVETLTEEVKKRRGKQPIVKDDEKVEPSKEVKDVPVRATRSRGQTSKDDNVVANLPPVEKKRTRRDDNVVVNPPIEKKRTRRDTIVIDLSSYNEGEDEKLGRGGRKKTSEVKAAEVPEIQENADKGKRPTRRTKATVEESKNEKETKEEVVIEKKVTRSKAVKESPKGKGKSKAEVQQIEEPSKPAGKRISNRRKSVFQPKDTEVVLPLEEPVNVPAKKDTRRKTVVPKAEVKETKKPAVTKKETVKETEVPESSKVKTPKTVGKKQSKDDSENEKKEVASPSGSQKSRKRRGEPVIEDKIIETEPVSTRKSSVAKKEPGSVVKTPASKRAKLSDKKQSSLKDYAEKSDAVGTPVSKMADLETVEKVEEVVENVDETEKTPAVVESGSRRFTRGARSEKKEAIQSAIKEHNTGAGKMSTHKTPGRSTRKKVEEKKQESESTHQSQPALGDAQIVPPEDAEDKPSQDVTSPVPSEDPKEAEVVISVSEAPVVGEDVPIEDASEVKSHDEICNGPVVETEKTPAVVESSRRVTRGGRSEKRGVIQSAMKEQNTGAGKMSTHKTPGRATRSGVKEDDEKKQESQPLDDAQFPSKPEDTDVSSPVPSEASKEVEGVITATGAPIGVEDSSPVPVEDDASGVKSHDEVCNGSEDVKDEKIPDETPSETVVSDINVTPVPVAAIDAVSDEIPEQEVNVNLGTVSEADVQVAVNLAKAVLRSVFPEVSEMANPGSQDDKVVEEPSVSAVKTVVTTEENVGTSLEQSDIKGKSKEVEASLTVNDASQVISDDEDEKVAVPESSLTTQSEPEKEVDDEEAPAMEVESTGNDVVEIPILGKSDDESGREGFESVKEHKSNMNDKDGGSEKEQEQLTSHYTPGMEDQTVGDDESEPVQNENVPEVFTDSFEQDLEVKNEDTTEEVVEKPTIEESSSVDNKQEDFGSYTDDFQKPVSADKEDDVFGQSTKDKQVSGLESSSPAVSNAPEEYHSWTDSTLKALLTTPGTTQASHVRDHEQNDTKGTSTKNPDSALFTTPATTQVSHIRDREQSTIKTSIPDEVGNATQVPDSSLKALFKTPAATQSSHVKHNQESTVRFDLPDKDDTEGNVSHHLDSSLKALFATPEEDDDNATQNPDSSLKALFTTPATTHYVKDRQESTVRFTLPVQDDDDAPQNVHSSMKTMESTWVSHRKDKQKTVAFAFLQDDKATTQTPGSSLKALFTTPATAQVTQEHIATPYPHSSLKEPLTTPATSHVKDHQQSTVRFDVSDQDDIEGGSVPQNQDSSLRTFFATPATTQTQVTTHQTTTVRFDDSFDQDKNQGSTTQNQDLGSPKIQTFEDITRSFFGDYSESEDNTTTQNPDLIEDPKTQTFEDLFYGDEDGNGSGDHNLGKDTNFDFNQMDDGQQAPGTSQHENNKDTPFPNK